MKYIYTILFLLCSEVSFAFQNFTLPNLIEIYEKELMTKDDQKKLANIPLWQNDQNSNTVFMFPEISKTSTAHVVVDEKGLEDIQEFRNIIGILYPKELITETFELEEDLIALEEQLRVQARTALEIRALEVLKKLWQRNIDRNLQLVEQYENLLSPEFVGQQLDKMKAILKRYGIVVVEDEDSEFKKNLWIYFTKLMQHRFVELHLQLQLLNPAQIDVIQQYRKLYPKTNIVQFNLSGFRANHTKLKNSYFYAPDYPSYNQDKNTLYLKMAIKIDAYPAIKNSVTSIQVPFHMLVDVSNSKRMNFVQGTCIQKSDEGLQFAICDTID